MKKTLIVLSVLTVAILFNGCSGSSSSDDSSDDSDGSVALSDIEGTSDVAIDSSFSYEFDQAVNTSTVSTESFFIIPTPTSSSLAAPNKEAYCSLICDVTNALDASVECSSSTKCVLDPTENLSEGTSYTACVAPSIEYASANWSIFIREAFAASSYVGARFTFTTAGEAGPPDVSGVYVTDDDECIDSSVIQASSTTENEYVFLTGEDDITLTMTDVDACTLVGMFDDEEVTWTCSYDTNQFTIGVTFIEEEESCTSILTKTDAVCGDGTCDYENVESMDSCPSDCSLEVTSISFIGDHNWSTTSPSNSCLAGVSGTTNFTIAVDSENDSGDALESYYHSFGTHFIRISRASGNYCEILFGTIGDTETNNDCPYVLVCNTTEILAICNLTAGDYCTLDLE